MLKVSGVVDLGSMWTSFAMEAAKRGMATTEAADYADRIVMEYMGRFGSTKAFCVRASVAMPYFDIMGMEGQVQIENKNVTGVITSLHSPNGDSRQPHWLLEMDIKDYPDDKTFDLQQVFVKFPG